MEITIKYGICSCCMEEIIEKKGKVTKETPVFFKVMTQHPEHVVNFCAFHYILDVDKPPMFINFSYNTALQVYNYYYQIGYIYEEDTEHYIKALEIKKND